MSVTEPPNHRGEKAELVQRALGGDRDALESLLLAYYPDLQRRVKSRMSKRLAQLFSVEDVLQLAYSRAFNAVSNFEPKSEHSFYGWLCRIADNQLIDLAKQRRRENIVDAPQSIRDTSTVDLLDCFTSEGLAPVDGAIRGEAARLLHVAIGGLPLEYKQVIELRDINGVELEDIAEQMGKTVDAVRALRHRAMKKLRMELIRLSRLL